MIWMTGAKDMLDFDVQPYIALDENEWRWKINVDDIWNSRFWYCYYCCFQISNKFNHTSVSMLMKEKDS